MKFVSLTVLLAACAGLSAFAAPADARHPESRFRRRFDPLLARAADQRLMRRGPGSAQFGSRAPVVTDAAPSVYGGDQTWLPAQTALAASWTTLGAAGFTAAGGPAQGRATSLWINPTNSSEIWAGFAGGGLWKTLNDGTTWTPVGDKFQALSIGAVTFDAANNRIFVGTGEGNFTDDGTLGAGVYASLNGGASFTLSALPWDSVKMNPAQRAVRRIAVDPRSPLTIYAAGDGGLYKGTLDAATGAINWGASSLHGGSSPGVNDIPYGGKYACGSSPVVYPLVAATDVVIDAVPNPSVIYVAFGMPYDDYACTTPYTVRAANGVYRSADAGANFTWIREPAVGNFTPVGLGTGIGRVALALARPENNITPLPQRLFVITHDVQTDGLDAVYYAQNPTTATFTTGWVKYQPANFLGTRGWFNLTLAADPAFVPASSVTPSRLFAGGLQVQLSNNGGATFSAVSASPAVHDGIHALALTNDGLTILAATDGGIYRGAVSGNSVVWQPRNSGGLNTLQFFGLASSPADATVLAGGVADQGEAHAAAGVWSAGNCGAAGCGDGGRSLFNAAGTSVYGEGAYAQLRISNDGGANYSCLRNFGGCACGTAACVPDLQSAYTAPLAIDGAGAVYTASKRLYKYTGGGFTALPPTSDLVSTGYDYATAVVTAIAPAPSNALIIYAGTSDGQVWRTLNGGFNNADWTHLSAAPLPASLSIADGVMRPVTAILVHPTDPAKIIVVYGGYSATTTTKPGHYFRSLNATAVMPVPGVVFTNLAPAGEPDLPAESALLSAGGTDFYTGLDRGLGRISDVFNTAARTFDDLTGNAPNASYFALSWSPAGKLRAASHGRGVFELQSVQSGPLPVADGRTAFGAPTLPLRLSKSGASFAASWDTGVCNSQKYNLYYGALTPAALAAGYTLSGSAACNVAGGSVTFADPGAANSYFFLVSGTDGAATNATDARLSQDSAGTYRGSGAGFCAVTATATATVCN